MEIYTDRDELMLKKYSPIASLAQFSGGTVKGLNDLTGYLALVCDTDSVLTCAGVGKKEFAGKAISARMEQIMEERKSYIANLAEGGTVVPVAQNYEQEVTAQVIVPIVAAGDCLGAVALLSLNKGEVIGAEAVKLAKLSATILANQFED
jgi:AbrB family transcriptional regulator (stage V sporulation protein T)